MIVALIALVMAMAGIAVAGPSATVSKLNKKKVKSIADKQIDKAAPTLSVANAETADSADIASNVYSANVQGDGTMLGSIPDGATSSKTALGTYKVSFGRPIEGCTISGSLANNTGPQIGMVAVGVLDANTMHVFTRDPTNTVADRPFYAQMICPAG
jgi:hypothetical protein